MEDAISVKSVGRAYMGVDRGFIFFENSGGAPWKGLTDLEESESEYLLETFYSDGKRIGQRHVAGNYSATLSSFDDPFDTADISNQIYGFSYRETFVQNQKWHYRLHIVHGVSINRTGVTYETVNSDPNPSAYGWELNSVDVKLSESIVGSHLILDSTIIQEWILRDIEDILYGWKEDTEPRMPSIEEMYEIFATMNLVIIDHGDGTWSAVGHETMIGMLDSTEFVIETPTAEYNDEQSYDIWSLIRDETWLE